MEAILIILYLVLGYWSTGKTVFANHIMIGTASGIFAKKFWVGLLFGWALIPVAIIKSIFFGRG
jgi:hypothetical protein